jgi:hypothetical protein
MMVFNLVGSSFSELKKMIILGWSYTEKLSSAKPPLILILSLGKIGLSTDGKLGLEKESS